MAAPKIEQPQNDAQSVDDNQKNKDIDEIKQTDINPAIDDEKMKDTEEMKQNIVIPTPSKKVMDGLSKGVLDLYNYKAKYVINGNGSITFYPTSNCKPSDDKINTSKINIDSILESENCSAALTYSDPDSQIIQHGKACSFITSSLLAWSQHYPFRFRAEHIWLLILQGVAVHVDKNAEKLRNKYVKHDGKKELKVFVSPNPSHEEWRGVIQNFAQQIDKNTVQDTCKLMECDFSTSSLTERIATKVTMMDICKNYFEYLCYTRCGFPQITLDGNKKDWIKLKEKVKILLESKVDNKFGKQWGEALLPLLDRFIVAFDGEIDCVFWNSMIKRGATFGSGARSWYSGWINILFPFLKKRWNEYCTPYSMEQSYISKGISNDGSGGMFGYDGTSGPNTSSFPTGIASAPVTWDIGGKLKFLAGFIGFKQDPKTLEICPNIGWCIANVMSDEEIKKKTEANKYPY